MWYLAICRDRLGIEFLVLKLFVQDK